MDIDSPIFQQAISTVKAAIDIYARNAESARRHLSAHLRDGAFCSAN